MHRILIAVLLPVITVAQPVIVLGWNEAGHMTTARVAWDVLNPDERLSVVEILKQHPHLNELLLKDRPEDATPNEWIFLRAASWADYVRPPKDLPKEEIPNHTLAKFHRGTWHYINFPYELGQKNDLLPAHPLPSETNILEQLDMAMNVLVEGNLDLVCRVPEISDEANCAVRLTWLFHQIGDLHQPLHSVSLVDRNLFPDPPYSDQGGNKLAIRTDSASPPKNLHWAWDDMFSTEPQFDRVRQNAERLTHDPELAPERLAELQDHRSFREWAAESYSAAMALGYLNGQLKLVRWEDVSTNLVPASDVPTLPPEDLRKAQRLAQRRIALAGYRLATKLREIIAKSPQ